MRLLSACHNASFQIVLFMESPLLLRTDLIIRTNKLWHVKTKAPCKYFFFLRKGFISFVEAENHRGIGRSVQ